jgi:catechol 2,3-dioxygenase-like lactoylglutathione lyase family enzyme
MPSYRCDHVHLKTMDIEGTARWYVDMLGAKITFEGKFKGSKVYYVDISGFTFVVYSQLQGEEGSQAPIPASLQARYGVDHFGFAVDDINSAVADLERKGVVVLERPWSPRPGVTISYIEGPDLVRIELTQRESTSANREVKPASAGYRSASS